MKPGLNPLQHLRVTTEDGQDLRIRLLEHANNLGQTFSPVCKTGAVVRSAQENNPPSAVENLLKMPFRSLLCCRESLHSSGQHLG